MGPDAADDLFLLTGDVGATKTALAVMSPAAGPRAPVVERTYPSQDFPALEALVSHFVAETGAKVDRAVFGVAGPVVGGSARCTNLPWEMSEDGLREALALQEVVLLNDLEAIACAVPSLRDDDLETLAPGQPEPRGTIAVVAPGTGLGEAFLVWDGARWVSHPSEGGHTDFAPTNGLQGELLDYLAAELGHVSYERICSGSGLPNVYRFLRDRGHAPEPDWLAERLAAAPDPTPVIVGAAGDPARSCELCERTVELFADVLGAEAGNVALTLFATGGVYLAGGMIPHLLPWLRRQRFTDAIHHKGRIARSDLMSRLAVHLVTRPNVALLGLGCRGMERRAAP